MEIIIPCYRDTSRLAMCIEGLARQVPPLQESVSRVHFVCDGGDRAFQWIIHGMIAGRFCESFHYLEPETELRREGAAFNLALHYCVDDRVLFLSDDMVCLPDVVAAHAAQAQADNSVALMGVRWHLPIETIKSLDPQNWTYEQLQQLVARPEWRLNEKDKGFVLGAKLGGGVFLCCHASVSTEAVKAIGGFDERFAGSWAGDQELGRRLYRSGITLVARPDLKAYHLDHVKTWGAPVQASRVELLLAEGVKRATQLRNRGGIPTLPLGEQPIWNC